MSEVGEFMHRSSVLLKKTTVISITMPLERSEKKYYGSRGQILLFSTRSKRLFSRILMCSEILFKAPRFGANMCSR